MKPYFAKYLPIKGEIKEGDWYIYRGTLIKCENPHLTTIPSVTKGECTKVKLFLCSRDIQVGDEIKAMWYFNDGSLSYQWGIVTGDGADNQLIPLPNYWNVKIPTKTEKRTLEKGNLFGRSTGEMVDVFIVKELPKEHSFKVIGEISPEATWVKEGDEFGEHEIAWITDDGSETKILIDKDWDWKHWNPKGAIFAVIGPCGHFH